MWKEISERQWRRLWPYLAVGDTLVGVVILPNVVASYWMGTWLIFDFYLFPSDLRLSAWICYGLGTACVIVSILFQQVLGAWFIPRDGEHSWRFVIAAHVYKYIMAFIGVMQWRGLAYVTVLYTGMTLNSAVVGLVGATILLALLRNNLGTLTPPLTMALDPDVVDSFSIPTKFSCQVRTASKDNNWERVGITPILSPLRGSSMATSVLHSQNFRFQITIYMYLIGNWDFF
jgi:hypothetical protein